MVGRSDRHREARLRVADRMVSGILRTPAKRPAATSSSASGVEPSRMPTRPADDGGGDHPAQVQTSILLDGHGHPGLAQLALQGVVIADLGRHGGQLIEHARGERAQQAAGRLGGEHGRGMVSTGTPSRERVTSA